MNFDWQQIISLAIVGISAILIMKGQIRSRRRAKLRGCGHDCGCSAGEQSKIIKKSQHIDISKIKK